MLSRPIANPPNPWRTTEVEYLEGAPEAKLEVFEDATREILATNDSPDIGFRWSVNPYRGCFHGCAYCLTGETRILLGDGTTRPLSELRAGDTVYGTVAGARYRCYAKTRVLAHWSTLKPAYRVTLEDGTFLVASGDHRFLTRRGWKYVTGTGQGAARRPHLTTTDRFLGVGAGLANCRKRDFEGSAIKGDTPLGVVAIERLGRVLPMFDITTGTGDFIANGVVSHNCYARPTHEYLGLGAGTDFERKITVKPRAAALLREAFDRPSWQGELVAFSGVTDCYQPLEASYRLTRGCLEVCADYRNPVGIVTKSPLIERDLELLVRLQREARLHVAISIPLWRPESARALEPFVATPQRRIETIRRLAAAGIDVGVNVAPLIPGLGDEELCDVLEAAAAAGARWAGFVFLRLPGSVAAVFEARLREALPLRADRIMNRVRDARGGKLYDPRFGLRQVGQGPHAAASEALFRATAKRLGLQVESFGQERPTTFRRPPRAGDQLRLF